VAEAEVKALVWRGACCLAVWTLVSAGGQAVAESATPPPGAISWDDGVPTNSLVSATLDPSTLSGTSLPDPRWRATESWVARGGAVDHVAWATTTSLPGAPVWLPAEPETYDFSFTRGWPSALSLHHGGYAVDVTPHAGVGMTSAGASAEGGATVRLGAEEALERLGVERGGVFGQRSRWYLYAEASGRAIGYNFLRTEEGWRRSGMSLDEGAYFGDAQAGVAWRRGDLQASFGYVDRTVRMTGWNSLGGSKRESLVAFTVSLKPTAR
jgi:hypothetical protein